MQGDSVGHQSTRSLPSYEEEDDDIDYQRSPSDDYAYDDEMRSYSDDKSGRYGREITDSPQRGRAGSGSSSANEKGLSLSGTPPRPPAHGSGYSTPRGGGAGGAGGAGTPAAFI